MDEYDMKPNSQFCDGCFKSRSEDVVIENYFLSSGHLRKVIQEDCLTLCVYCKKLARNTEIFIDNVVKSQAALKLNTIGSMVFPQNEFKSRLKLGVSTMYLVEVGVESTLVENFAEEDCTELQYENESKATLPAVKQEQELSIQDFDNVQDGFPEVSADYEEEPSIELEDIKCDLSSNDIYIQFESEKLVKCFKKKRKSKRKISNQKCSKNRNSDTSQIKVIYLSEEECALERHKMAATKLYLNSVYKCSDCIKGFAFKDSYDKHMLLHSNVSGEFICSVCKQRRKTEEQLNAHENIHYKRYKCCECGLTSSYAQGVVERCQHLYRSYTCDMCQKTFFKRSYLRKHIHYKHNQKQRMACKVCNKTYVNREVLRCHFQTKHESEAPAVKKEFVCKDCGKEFRYLSNLKNHSSVHSDTKEFYCVECDKTFKSAATLKQHLERTATHLKKLKYQCDRCDRRFASKRSRDRHVDAKHLNNVKQYPCSHCDKIYLLAVSLKEHIAVVHEGIKRPLNFTCTVCDKMFHTKHILKEHMRTHTGERPYHCPQCAASFTQAGVLRTHQRLVHVARGGRGRRPRAGGEEGGS